MSVLVVQHLVTLSEATKILRLFKQKKHSKLGYYFELDDLGATMLKATALPGLEPYRETPEAKGSPWWKENAYLLRVYRDVSAR